MGRRLRAALPPLPEDHPPHITRLVRNRPPDRVSLWIVRHRKQGSIRLDLWRRIRPQLDRCAFHEQVRFSESTSSELRPCEGSGGITGHRRVEDARGGSLPWQLSVQNAHPAQRVFTQLRILGRPKKRNLAGRRRGRQGALRPRTQYEGWVLRQHRPRCVREEEVPEYHHMP